MKCHSLFNPSGYKETDLDYINDTKWHINNFDDNHQRAFILLTKLKTIYPDAQSFLDIGCGIGATILQAKQFQLNAKGVEPNHYAVNYSKTTFSLEIKCDYFQKDTFDEKFDIITCTHVLEHLENPRNFIIDTIGILNRPGLLFLSVPWPKKIRHQIRSILFPDLKNYPYSTMTPTLSISLIKA